MAKLTLTDLGTTLSNTAATTININHTLIEEALENTLSRDGTTPNQMESDIDLNNNDLLNAGTVQAETFILNGVGISPDTVFLEDGDRGDIVITNSGTVWTIDDDVLSDYGRVLIANTTASLARSDLGLIIGTDVQAYDAGLQSIAGLTTAADKLPYTTGSDTYATTDFTAYARTLLDDADATTALSTLGVSTFAKTILDDAAASDVRTTLGLGTAALNATGDFQPIDADLTAIAALTSAADRVPYSTGAGTWSLATLTSAGRDLLDDASASAQRTTLGLTTGTYTPTLTNTLNIASSTPGVCQWMRINNMITVSGNVVIDPTTTGAVQMGVSLPVASNFASTAELGGTYASVAATTPEAGGCFADATNDRAEFRHVCQNTASANFFFIFMYQVI